MPLSRFLLIGFFAAGGFAQTQQPADMQQILNRLDKLERENDDLRREIQQLRDELQAKQEQQAATEARVDEQAQTKVAASQKYPIELTGMALFDGGVAYGPRNSYFESVYSDESLGPRGLDAGLRQSIIGLAFHGPELPGGGKVYGDVSMDFYSANGDDDVFRLRRGVITLNWNSLSVTFGQDKPLIAPFAPQSYARVGVPALAGAGNLWLWLPQARFDQRFRLSAQDQFTASAEMIVTEEPYWTAVSGPGMNVQQYRPGFEMRGQWKRSLADDVSYSAGLGAHFSTSHVNGQAAPSRVVSADFELKPKAWMEFTGTALTGENFGALGGVPSSVSLQGTSVIPIRGSAGWLQASLPVTSKLTFDVYGGRQWNRAADLNAFQVSTSLTYAGNVLYRIAPNVVLGFEAAQSRIQYLNGDLFKTNRYDITAAYLF